MTLRSIRVTGSIWMAIALLGCAKGAASGDGAVASTPRAPAAIAPSVANPPPPVGVSEDALCDGMADMLAEFAAQPECQSLNCQGSPSCGVTLDTSVKLAAPWRQLGVFCQSRDNHYAAWHCALALDTNGWWLGPPAGHDMALTATIQHGVAGDDREFIIIAYHSGLADNDREVTVCASDHRCTTPRASAKGDWEAMPTLVGGHLVLTTTMGTPPPGAAGRFALDLHGYEAPELTD